jgi:hypothetical protein
MVTQGRLEIVSVEIDKIKPDKKNARKHSKRNIDEIKRSLSDLGQHRPFVVQKSTGRILIGNGMYVAMKELGWETAQVIYVDDDDETAAKRSLADNRTAELAEWDWPVFKDIMQELGPEPDIPGWTDSEIEDLVGYVGRDEEDNGDASPQERSGGEVLFSLGEIQVKIGRGVYDQFIDAVPDVDRRQFIERALLDGCKKRKVI